MSSSNNRGFTLVEVLVAMVIILVAMMGLLQSVNILTETNVRNQIRDESVQVGQKVLNDLMVASLTDATFDNYSAKIPSRLRGINKNYFVRGTRSAVSGGMKSINVTVRVVSTYRNVSSVTMVSALRALND